MARTEYKSKLGISAAESLDLPAFSMVRVVINDTPSGTVLAVYDDRDNLVDTYDSGATRVSIEEYCKDNYPEAKLSK